MPEKKSVSIVLASYNRRRLLMRTINSARGEIEQIGGGEIIVVDGGSVDGSVEWLIEQKDVLTIIQHNRGTWRGKSIKRRSWGYFMNLGFKAATHEFICMISDDCLIVPGSLQRGIEAFDRAVANGKGIGAVAFYWRNWPEQQKYWVGRTLGKKIFVNHGLYRKTALAEIDYADEVTYAFYHADGDLCLRLWEAGWVCVDCPTSFVEHYSHANQTSPADVSVRESNFSRQADDWQTYLSRWSHLNGPEDAGFVGDWIELAHEDPMQTWRQFAKLSAAESPASPPGRMLDIVAHLKAGVARLAAFRPK